MDLRARGDFSIHAMQYYNHLIRNLTLYYGNIVTVIYVTSCITCNVNAICNKSCSKANLKQMT